MLSRDRMQQRMQVMATERDKMRAARLAELAKKDGQGRLRHDAQGLHAGDRRPAAICASAFDTEEVRDKLKMAGLRGQAPLVAYMFFRVAMPIIVAVVALLYLFVIADYGYPPIVKLGMAIGAGYRRLLPAQHVHREPGAAAPDLDQAGLPRRARHAADLRAVGHVDRGGVRQGVEGGRQPVARAGRGAVSLTTAELSYLQDRRQAFENLGKRTGIPGIKAVATALIQAERYGTPVGQALRVMAKENRDMRMSEAEKKAAALPPKLTVPMILFFLPVLFVVILGPAAIRFWEFN